LNREEIKRKLIKILISSSIVILLIISIVFIFNRPKTKGYVELSKGNGSVVGEITRGTIIEQEIPFYIGDCGLSIKFATFARKNLGKINIRIEGEETGFIYVNQNKSVYDFKDNVFEDFIYEGDLPRLNEILKISITSTSKSGQGITICNTDDDEIPDLSLKVDGESLKADLIMRRIVMVPGVGLGWRLIGLTLIASLICLMLLLITGDKTEGAINLKTVIKRIKERVFREVEPGLIKYTGIEAKAFFSIILLVGLLIIMIMPPFVSPDEYVHFENIWPISQGHIFAHSDGEKNVRFIPRQYLEYINTYPISLNGNNNPNRYSFWLMASETDVVISTDDLVSVEANITSLGYVFSALAMRLGTWFGELIGFVSITNAYNQMQIGRIGNLLFYSLMVYFAIKRAPHFKLSIGLIACMPMALFQGCSLSYDAVLIPTTLYFISLILSLSTYDPRPLTTRDIICVYLSVIMMVGVKSAYAPLLVMLLAVPKYKYATTKRMYICISGAIIAGFIGLLPTLCQNSLVVPLSPEVQSSLMTTKQTNWLIHNLTAVPQLIKNTFSYHYGLFLNSFWGSLGWLDTRFGTYWIEIGYFILLVVGLYEAFSFDGWIGKRWKNILPLLGWITSLVGVFLGLYIYFTADYAATIGGMMIYGIQGRYMIPYFLPLLLCISNRSIKWIQNDSLTAMISKISCGWGLVCSLITFVNLFTRYWM